MIQRLIGCGVVVVWACVWVVPMSVQAAEPPAVMQQAMMGLGPLPGASVIQPLTDEGWDEMVSRHAWPMPERRAWPMSVDDHPIVVTRRKDELVHTVRSWETVGRLRTLYRKTTAQLQELNPELDVRDLNEGDEVVVWKRDEGAVSESRGEPQAGRLIYGEPIPDSDHYIVQYPHRTFGTYYTVSETVRVLDAYYERFPNADPLVIGDASRRVGRAMSPHSSHQSGRDIDISLPRHDEPPDYQRIYRVWPKHLHAEHTLWVLTSFIEGGYVKYIFLDWNHQRTLWELAKEQGAPEAWLEAVFEYPERGSLGIIRHEPGHAGHFHVRFYCQQTDEWCR